MKTKAKYYNKATIKSEVVEAIQFHIEDLNTIIDFVGCENVMWSSLSESLWVKTSTGDQLVKGGDWIVKKGRKGYAILPNVDFTKLYEKIGK